MMNDFRRFVSHNEGDDYDEECYESEYCGACQAESLLPERCEHYDYPNNARKNRDAADVFKAEYYESEYCGACQVESLLPERCEHYDYPNNARENRDEVDVCDAQNYKNEYCDECQNDEYPSSCSDAYCLTNAREDRDEVDVSEAERYESQHSTVYHYTTWEGAKAIAKSRIIKSSKSSTDAVFGQGVYTTKMEPSRFKKEDIAQNNYDGRDSLFLKALENGKIDYVIKMTVPKRSFRKVSWDRDIWLHDGDWDLDDCIQWTIEQV